MHVNAQAQPVESMQIERSHGTVSMYVHNPKSTFINRPTVIPICIRFLEAVYISQYLEGNGNVDVREDGPINDFMFRPIFPEHRRLRLVEEEVGYYWEKEAEDHTMQYCVARIRLRKGCTSMIVHGIDPLFFQSTNMLVIYD